MQTARSTWSCSGNGNSPEVCSVDSLYLQKYVKCTEDCPSIADSIVDEDRGLGFLVWAGAGCATSLAVETSIFENNAITQQILYTVEAEVAPSIDKEEGLKLSSKQDSVTSQILSLWRDSNFDSAVNFYSNSSTVWFVDTAVTPVKISTFVGQTDIRAFLEAQVDKVQTDEFGFTYGAGWDNEGICAGPT